MPILRIDHAVRDFDTWKEAFDGDPVGRAAGGVRRHLVARPADEPNHVLADLEFATVEEAETFRARLEELWSRLGDRLGLESPTARLLEVVERKEY